MISTQQYLTIGFGDADPAGLIFYPRALALAHGAVEELIRQSPLGWDAWYASPAHAAPLRRVEADFLIPMRPGENITAQASVEKLGTTSVTFRVDFHDRSGRTAATIRTTHVLIDKATGRAIPLSNEIRSAFAG